MVYDSKKTVGNSHVRSLLNLIRAGDIFVTKTDEGEVDGVLSQVQRNAHSQESGSHHGG